MSDYIDGTTIDRPVGCCCSPSGGHLCGDCNAACGSAPRDDFWSEHRARMRARQKIAAVAGLTHEELKALNL